MFPLAAVALSVAALPVSAAHHENRNYKHVDPARIKWSAESRRLAEVCRRDPSPENRAALRRQLERDFDRFVDSFRAKLKPGKLSHEQRRRLDDLLRERDRTVNAEMRRLLEGAVPGDRGKKPKPPRKSR